METRRKYLLQTSLEYYRKMTIQANKVNLNYNICMELAKGGFYYDTYNRIIKCCMGCREYNVEYISNAKTDKFNFVKYLHNFWSFQPTIIGSKLFSEYKFSLIYEKERLNSFIEFPSCHIIDPKTLAKDGFYYERYEDVCCCIFCNLRIYPSQLLLKECSSLNDIHATSSPNCSFLTGNLIGIHDVPNIPLEISNILDNMVMPGDHYPLPNEDSYFMNDD